jgi:hypothetical protein
MSIAVRAIDDPAGRVSRIPGEGAAPLWSADGKWLYYRSGARFLATSFRGGNQPALGNPRVLFEGDYVQPTQWSSNTFFDQSSGRFLVGIPEREAEASAHIEVITNWVQETTTLISSDVTRRRSIFRPAPFRTV